MLLTMGNVILLLCHFGIQSIILDLVKFLVALLHLVLRVFAFLSEKLESSFLTSEIFPHNLLTL